MDDKPKNFPKFSKSKYFSTAIENLKLRINYYLEELLMLKPKKLTQSSIFIDCSKAKDFNTNEKKKYLFIDQETYEDLCINENVLNWHSSLAKLYPINTCGDGNCLCHAIMISLIGIHDYSQCLRTALYTYMNDPSIDDQLKLRFIRQRKLFGRKTGIEFSQEDLDKEWLDAKHRSTTNKEDPDSLYFLEDIHVFVLANLLKRPIIVLSADYINQYQPTFIRGIYLPTLYSPNMCFKKPILICFHQSHFTPLIYANKNNTQQSETNHDTLFDNSNKTLTYKRFPLVTSNFEQLPIQFLTREEEKDSSLLSDYLMLSEICNSPNEKTKLNKNIICCDIHGECELNILSVYFDYYLNNNNNNKETTPSIKSTNTRVSLTTKSYCIYPKCYNSVKYDGASFCIDHSHLMRCSVCNMIIQSSKNGKCHNCTILSSKRCKNDSCNLLVAENGKEYCDTCIELRTNERSNYLTKRDASNIKLCAKYACANTVSKESEDYCYICMRREKNDRFLLPSNVIIDSATRQSSPRTSKITEITINTKSPVISDLSNYTPNDTLSRLKMSQSMKRKCKNISCNNAPDFQDGYCKACYLNKCSLCKNYAVKDGYCYDCHRKKSTKLCAIKNCYEFCILGKNYCANHSSRFSKAINLDKFVAGNECIYCKNTVYSEQTNGICYQCQYSQEYIAHKK